MMMVDETAQMIPTPSFAEKKRDRRLAALVDSAVHQAMEKHRAIDWDNAEEAAFRIARDAVTLALTTAFNDDAELKYTREMLEKTIEAFHKSVSLRPSPMFMRLAPPS